MQLGTHRQVLGMGGGMAMGAMPMRHALPAPRPSQGVSPPLGFLQAPGGGGGAPGHRMSGSSGMAPLQDSRLMNIASPNVSSGLSPHVYKGGAGGMMDGGQNCFPFGAPAGMHGNGGGGGANHRGSNQLRRVMDPSMGGQVQMHGHGHMGGGFAAMDPMGGGGQKVPANRGPGRGNNTFFNGGGGMF